MTEEWRDVPGYSGTYQVSSFGNVRSSGGKFLRGSRVDLYRDGRRDNRSVAELVMQVFGESPPEPGLRILHRDGDKGNSRISNLHWDGRSASRPGEEWCDIPGFEGLYQASTLGNIRSLNRMVDAAHGSKRLHKGRVLRPSPIGRGKHLAVRLGKRGLFYVHRLVAATFIGAPPEGKPNVLHRDDNPNNNTVTNLRYGTQAENAIDSILNGNHFQASKTRCPRGHRLASPNLKAGSGRSCLSCAAADSWARCRAKSGEPVSREEWEAHADSRYGEIEWDN